MSGPRGGRYPTIAMRGMRMTARVVAALRTSRIRVDGLENVPREGPALLVARHYHHVLDGVVLLSRIPRPIHVVVALDWAKTARERRTMEAACRLARWPVILRARTLAAGSAYARAELLRYLRTGLRDAAAHLSAGRVVVVFPEGYPVVDRAGMQPPARDAGGILPLADGYRTIAALARRDGAPAFPTIPVGFAYAGDAKRPAVTMRIGLPLLGPAPAATVEEAIRALSAPPPR